MQITAIINKAASWHTPYWLAYILIFSADFFYGISLRNLGWAESAQISVIHTLFYIGILYASLRMDIAKLTISYLAIPYLLFFVGWLNVPTAAIMICLFVFSSYKAITQSNSSDRRELTINELFPYLILIAWVNISGSGGYGYQSWDYVMHNSRLNDLIELSWPVHYGKDMNLVYYVGYYLPAAAIGKLQNHAIANATMFFWTLLGIALVYRWICILTEWKSGILICLIMIFFGPIDAAGLIWVICNKMQLPPDITVQVIFEHLLKDTDILDFWASNYLNLIIGNFLSNTFQLYWAPQHIIPGWLLICILTDHFFKKDFRNFIFIYSLLCLWSPLVMAATVLFPAIAAISENPVKNRQWLTFSNTVAAPSITIIFIFFYFGGSASVNFTTWTTLYIDFSEKWDGLLAFYIFTWGLYLAAIFPHTQNYSREKKTWFTCLFLAMSLIPIYVYGDYGDLLSRGAAPMMLLLMIFFMQHIREKWLSNEKITLIAASFLILTGSCSALLQIHTGITQYGQTREAISVVKYKHARENLGGDNSVFAKFFRKNIE